MSDLRGEASSRRDDLITSPANPTIKIARSLRRRRVRHRERAILVEGARALGAAIAHGANVRAVLVDDSRRDQLDDTTRSLVEGSGARVLRVAPDLYATVAETETPQAVLGICDMPEPAIPTSATLVLALDGVRDPGNLGTLVRASAAAGADAVALLPHTVDAFNPKAVRASAGAIFAIPVAHFRDLKHVREGCFATPPMCVVADGDGETSYADVDWTQPTLLVIGGEAAGAGDAARTYADIVARIPIHPAVESLNAAIAGSVMLFEARRQRSLAH